MKLRPVIASYSTASNAKIRHYLDESMLQVIASIACSPKSSTEIPRDVLAELIEMHVLKEQDGIVRLDTAVFLRKDINQILSLIAPLAEELSQRIIECGSAFRNAPPEIAIFLGGILGLVQGLGVALRQKNVGVDWRSYSGKYTQSKVDFDEICDVYDAISPDFLNKSVLQGEQYTAVFIGPEGQGFPSFTSAMGASDPKRCYVEQLNRYLVDAYAMLVKGEMQSETLRLAAEAAKIYKHGKPRTVVVTNETIAEYGNAIRSIADVTSSHYVGQMHTLSALLRSTTAGQQGVPPANMMLNLFRYIRKLTAKELYSRGFFRDTIPEDGALTVFYENNVGLIRELLI